MENGIGLRRLTYLSQRNEQINESTNSHKMYILKCSHFDGVNRIITIMVMVILKVRRAYLEREWESSTELQMWTVRIAFRNERNADPNTRNNTTYHSAYIRIFAFRKYECETNKWQYPWLTLKTLISYYTHGLFTNIHNHSLIYIHWVLHSLHTGDPKFLLIASYRLSINIIIILVQKKLYSQNLSWIS